MPIAVIFVGGIMIVLAFRGTEHQFARQLGTDFANGEYLSWMAAVVIIGSLGYAKPLRPLSSLLLALVVVVLAVSHRGLFAQLQQLIQHPPAPTPAVPISAYPQPPSAASSGGGASADNSGAQAAQTAATIAEIAAVVLL